MALQGSLAIIPVIASKAGRRFAEDIAHSGLLSLLKASFRAIIESLCPSSRSLYSHPAGLAAFLWEPAADPTELNPCPACRAGSHSCKEHARRQGSPSSPGQETGGASANVGKCAWDGPGYQHGAKEGDLPTASWVATVADADFPPGRKPI